MRRLRQWLLRVFWRVRCTRTDRDMDAELESHLAFHIEDNLRAGIRTKVGGRQEARTPDLRVANAALSQLS